VKMARLTLTSARGRLRAVANLRGCASAAESVARARSGGRKAHALGVAHTWSAEEAREAGRKGGKSWQARLRKAREVATMDEKAVLDKADQAMADGDCPTAEALLKGLEKRDEPALVRLKDRLLAWLRGDGSHVPAMPPGTTSAV
jgi:hypothetical protein